MARFMMIMRGTDETDAAFAASGISLDEVMEQMGRFNQELIDAGVLVAAEGLEEASKGVVVDYSQTPPVVTDGPYGETKELFNGFWILETPTQEEAVEWAKRAPLGRGTKIEVRRVHGVEDFPQDNEWIQKEIEWREQLGTN